MRFPFFIILSLALHLAWLSFDDPFSPRSPSQQLSFGYISCSRDGFIPDPEPQSPVREAVTSEMDRSLAKTIPSDPPSEEIDTVKKGVVTSAPRVVSPKPPLREVPPVDRSSSSSSSSVVVTATPDDLDAVNTPLLIDGDDDVEADVTMKGAAFPGEAASQHEDVDDREGAVLSNENRVSGEFQAALPRYDLNPKPVYPEVARRRGWEGTVLFEVLILETGRVGAVEMLQSSGHRSLDRAARKAIRGWIFRPAISLGRNVDSRAVVPIDFVLDQDEGMKLRLF